MTTLSEVTAAAIGVAFGIALCADTARAQTAPTPNQEVIPSGEAEATRSILGGIEEIVNGAFASGIRPARRDAHAKAHGCVKADFAVKSDIPANLRRGVFAAPRSYAAWIRFSNGNGKPQDDHTADGRGMAIKLTGVDGPKLLADEAGTQDFVMINYPVFFIRNAVQYAHAVEAGRYHLATVFFLVHPHELHILRAMEGKASQVFEERYFSMTPYLLGERYIKFSARPVDCGSGAAIAPSPAAPPGGPNFLRDRMVEWMNAKDACFVFGVQPQTDPAAMPVEDPTILWDEAKAPFVDVATIRIPKQKFDSEAQQTFCENLSYAPWHALVEHRPAGGINRVRKAVYEAISALRHKLNNAPHIEPTGNETFN